MGTNLDRLVRRNVNKTASPNDAAMAFDWQTFRGFAKILKSNSPMVADSSQRVFAGNSATPPGSGVRRSRGELP